MIANTPDYYKSNKPGSGLTCIDAIRNALTPEEYMGFLKGNIIKYTWRERGKNQDGDMRKCANYAEMAYRETLNAIMKEED